MFSLQFLKNISVCFTLGIFLTPETFYIRAVEGQNRMSLGRDMAYDGVTSIDPQYVVTKFQGLNFPTCVRSCFSHSPECAALLYSKTLLNCTLLKCHLNDKLTKDSTKGDNWEYWRNYQGNAYFYI
jgi:hypothetical protein